MANTIKIKRKPLANGAGVPSSLVAGELAFSEADAKLFYGLDSGGSVSPIEIAGSGYIVTKIVDTTIAKSPSSTDGYVPTWSGSSGNALGTGYSIETTLTGGSGALPRADAVKNYVDSLLGATDAMVFKGTIGSGGTVTSLPTTHSAGWTYRVITAGTYAGQVCEVGDLIIAVVDRSGTGNLNSDWTVAQNNLDGAVIGPASATSDGFVLFDGTTGKLIKDGGFTTVPINKGGTGQTTYTDGQLLIGNSTGNTLTKSTLTEGTGIDITNGAGSITITHEDTSTLNGLQGGNGIASITVDGLGHVTAIGTATYLTSGTVCAAIADCTIDGGTFT